MNTNSYFDKGTSHDVCQDYALSGNINDNYYLIVTDGCSASHDLCKQVDFGARILSYSAKKYLTTFLYNCKDFELKKENICKLFSVEILSQARIAAQHLMLSPMALDSTLIIAITDGNKSYVFIYGDGGLIVQYPNGDTCFTEITYLSGAPYYLSYALDQERQKGYSKEFGCSPVVITDYKTEPNKEPVIHNKVIEKADENIYLSTCYEINGASSISLVSDGVKSFQCYNDQGNTVDISAYQMAMEFTNFKNFHGNFVERRILALKRQLEKTKTHHYDDISISSWVKQ